MGIMEMTEDLARLACLLAKLNKEGLDTDLIELGTGLLPKLDDDQEIVLGEDLEKVKVSFKEYQEGIPKNGNCKPTESSKKLVRAYVDGWYDLMHAGHYNSLRQSSKLGDVLVCGVNSDLEISLVKGPPVFNIDERCKIAGACKWVDEVAPDTPYTPTLDTLDELNCDFYAHGDDVSINKDGLDWGHELKAVGRFKLFKRTRGVSTTDLQAKLLDINRNEIKRLGLKVDEEEKTEEKTEPETALPTEIPKTLGSFNANPNFLASAKRIAQFASLREPLETYKIVYVDGSFDIYHSGHIELLQKARELGDYLIVGIHEDHCVNQYLGSQYPISSLHERVLNILACKYVDDVIIGAPYKLTERLIKDLNISVVVKSLDLIQGNILSQALELNPYEVPTNRDLVVDVEIESTLTLKEIARRVAENREAMKKKVLRSSFKQEEYENNSKYIGEIR